MIDSATLLTCHDNARTQKATAAASKAVSITNHTIRKVRNGISLTGQSSRSVNAG